MFRSMRDEPFTIWERFVVGLVGLVVVLVPSAALAGVVLTLNQINIERFPEIRIYLTAADERATPLKGLTASNFSVQEDGSTVRVEGVLPLERGEEPLSVVLAIDRSGSMKGRPIRDARQAAVDFIGEMRGIDRVGVVSFDDHVTVISRPSSDKGALEKAIGRITVGRDTALNDAIVKALELLSPFTGRRAVVVLTDGKENRSTATRKVAIDTALETGVPVITVGLGEEVDANALETIAGRTGGRSFFAQESGELPDLYRAIARQLINQYRITVQSKKSLDSGWHRLRIQLTTAKGKAEVERLYLATLTPSMGTGALEAYRQLNERYYVAAIILIAVAVLLVAAIIAVAVVRSRQTKGVRSRPARSGLGKRRRKKGTR
jgi:Ca-activated chloride channel family protein